MSSPNLYLGLDVHEDSVTVAVFGAHDREPRLLEELRLLAENQVVGEDHLVLGEYLALLEYTLYRCKEPDRRTEELALAPNYKPVVDRLRCFRRIETHFGGASTEIGDWRRFGQPPLRTSTAFGVESALRETGQRA